MRPLAHTSSYGSINVRPLVHWGSGDQRRDVRLALALLVVLGQHRLVRLVLGRGPGAASAPANLRSPNSISSSPVVPEFLLSRCFGERSGDTYLGMQPYEG